jgi:hypothetical protein
MPVASCHWRCRRRRHPRRRCRHRPRSPPPPSPPPRSSPRSPPSSHLIPRAPRARRTRCRPAPPSIAPWNRPSHWTTLRGMLGSVSRSPPKRIPPQRTPSPETPQMGDSKGACVSPPTSDVSPCLLCLRPLFSVVKRKREGKKMS